MPRPGAKIFNLLPKASPVNNVVTYPEHYHCLATSVPFTEVSWALRKHVASCCICQSSHLWPPYRQEGAVQPLKSSQQSYPLLPLLCFPSHLHFRTFFTVRSVPGCTEPAPHTHAVYVSLESHKVTVLTPPPSSLSSRPTSSRIPGRTVCLVYCKWLVSVTFSVHRMYI